MTRMEEFEKDLQDVINRHGIDSFLDMPDFIITKYMKATILSLKKANEDSKLHSGVEEPHTCGTNPEGVTGPPT